MVRLLVVLFCQKIDDAFEPKTVGVVESGELFAVDVEHSHHLTVEHQRHHNLAARTAAASYMPRKQVNIGHHLRGGRSPSSAAHSATVLDASASQRTLKGTQMQFAVDHAIESRPPKVESEALTCWTSALAALTTGPKNRLKSMGMPWVCAT